MRETYRWSIYACELERPPPPHTHKEREMEREGEGPTRFVCWMCATEWKIVGERESRSPGEVAFYASKTDINHVLI